MSIIYCSVNFKQLLKILFRMGTKFKKVFEKLLKNWCNVVSAVFCLAFR